MEDKLSTGYCFDNNSDFLRIVRGVNLVIIRRCADSPAMRDCLEDPEKYLSAANIIKDSRSTKAGLTTLSDGTAVFIKRYNNKGLRYTLKYMFSSAKPFRTWKAAWHLEMSGIPTPKPLAATASRTAGILTSAYLIAESVPGIISTIDFCKIMYESRKIQKIYAESIAAMMSKMHDAGVYHGDTKLSNIFVSKIPNGDFTFGFWDLDSVDIRAKPIGENLRASELGRTASSFIELGVKFGKYFKHDEMAALFLKSYMPVSGIVPDLDSVLRKTEKYLKNKLLHE
jgi:tRNA A-37 threonylcarbamoyl transferase component Bud32